MSKSQVKILSIFCCSIVSVLAIAQAARKPGLWQVTSTMTWQKTPLPPGVNLPAGVQNPFGPRTQTSNVCLTQEMLDKYGAPLNAAQPGENCTVSNVVRRSNGMTADLTCTGRMNAHATIESSWSGGNTMHSKVHFTGTTQMGATTIPEEYTVESDSTYKGADCGSVKPLPMPATK